MPTLEQEEIALLKGRVNRLEARLEILYQHLNHRRRAAKCL